MLMSLLIFSFEIIEEFALYVSSIANKIWYFKKDIINHLIHEMGNLSSKIFFIDLPI